MLSLVLYRFGLDYIYSNWIVLHYSNYGFISNFSFTSYILSILLFISGTIMLRYDSRSSSIIINFLTLFYFVPFTTMVAFNAFDNKIYIVYFIIYWLLLILFSTFLNKIKCNNMIMQNRYVSVNTKKIILNIFVGIITINILYVILFHTGINISFNLYDIYKFRSNVDYNSIPTVCMYVLNGSKLYIPIIFFFYYYHNNYKGMTLLFIIGMLCFVALRYKSVIFVEICILLILILKRFINRDSINKYAVIGISISVLEIFWGKTYYMTDFIIRRVCFLTNLLSYDYFVYFLINEPDYFRSSFLRWFGFVSPFKDLSVVKSIGLEFFGSSNISANNGMLADVFANTGYIGLILMPLVIALLLMFIDFITIGVPFIIILLPCLIIAMNLIDTFLFVTLLTHGLLLSMFLFTLMPRE